MHLTMGTKTARAVEKKALKGIDPNYGTPGRRRNLIRLVMERGPHCEHCGTDVHLKWMVPKKYHKGNKRKEATFDHRIPKSKGGTYDLSNGILSCKSCNIARGQMSVGKFRSIIKQHGGVEEFKKARKERRRQKRAERRLKRAPQQAEFLMNLAILLYLLNKQHEISSSSL